MDGWRDRANKLFVNFRVFRHAFDIVQLFLRERVYNLLLVVSTSDVHSGIRGHVFVPTSRWPSYVNDRMCHEARSIKQLPHPEISQAADASRHRPSCAPFPGTPQLCPIPGHIRRRGLRYYRQRSGKHRFIPSPGHLHGFVSQNHIHRSRQTPSRHLVRVLLHSHPLPIDESTPFFHQYELLPI